MLAIGLLTTRGVSTLDEAVHLDRADAWAGGTDTLSIDPAELWVPTAPMAGGLFYDAGDGLRSASPPGLAAIAFPLVAPARWLGREPVGASLGALAREGPVEATLRDLRHDPRALGFSLIGPVCAALTLLFFLLAARGLELSTRAQLLGAAALALGSPLLVYAGTCWTQLPVTALLAFALWQTVERDRRSGLRATALGLALGLAVLVRAECLLFAIPFGVATYRTEHRWRRTPSRALARVILPLALAVGGLVLLGLPASGGGWRPSNLLVGLPGSLISPRAGLLVYAPFAALSGSGAATLRDRPLIWPLVGVPAIALGVYGGWFDWHASLAYGPRLLLPVLPMLALAFAASADRWPRASFGLIALGFGIALPGALIVHARVPEADAFWDPTPLRAWATAPAVDWMILESAPVAAALLVVAAAGLLWERRRALIGKSA
ncbi:MAG: hypothetical protein H6719_37640 [Sandaracinaceae bacterium]|nr:hypothetical protein [Sandaracinaceae bacterium]